MMQRYLVVLCALALLLGSLPARAAGPAPVRLSPEARERFAAAMAFYRAGDWAQAAREFGEASAIAAPIAEYALLQQADSLARLGDIAASRAAAQQAADLSPESRAVAPALLLAADQASRTGDDVAAAALWRRFLDRFPDHAEASRARLRMGQSLVAAGRPGDAMGRRRRARAPGPGGARDRGGGAHADPAHRARGTGRHGRARGSGACRGRGRARGRSAPGSRPQGAPRGHGRRASRRS